MRRLKTRRKAELSASRRVERRVFLLATRVLRRSGHADGISNVCSTHGLNGEISSPKPPNPNKGNKGSFSTDNRPSPPPLIPYSSKSMTTSEKASSASTASVIPKNSIQQVKDLIETHEFMRALKIIQALQSEYPHSAQLLVLEALVYETTSHSRTLAVCLEAKKPFLNVLDGVFYHLFNKQVDAYDFSEPEALLVYISVTEQQAKCDIAHEILFNLGSTLVVAEVCRRRLKGGRLLSHLCDYGAAAEVLGQKFESCKVLNGGSPGDWESIINNLGQLLEDDSKWCAATNDNQIHLPMFFVCELSQFTSEMSRIGRSSPVYNKEYNSLPYQRKKYKLEEAVPEYFNRLGSNGGMSLRVLTNAEEGWVCTHISHYQTRVYKKIRGKHVGQNIKT
ncbi:uncharacterized protein LOC113360611 [Papaver somniferum]|uniref:uncharacterized protein LOC113360611 n=1 Tax=Papaver somniferum TaxID=3469 RepID=UPI000E6F6091|nr:uncharacterized protein LOC113360611 [Papaver somniferum]